MRHRRDRAGTPYVVWFTDLIAWARTRLHRAQPGRDRGANVVETIIIVAGFAILAAAIYAAVAGKVHTWIAKIP